MKNNTHPAIETAKKDMRTRYIITALCFVVCAVLIVLGFVFKPKETLVKAEVFSKDTEIDTYVKSDITLISPMFSQDDLDENGKVIGENYFILAADTECHRFMLCVPKEYYENNLTDFENNAVQDIESGKLEILDSDLKITVYGYAKEMSTKLKAQLKNYLEGYESVLFPYVLEGVEKPQIANSINWLFVAGGFVGLVTLVILITAFSKTAYYKKTKKKYSEEQ